MLNFTLEERIKPNKKYSSCYQKTQYTEEFYNDKNDKEKDDGLEL